MSGPSERVLYGRPCRWCSTLTVNRGGKCRRCLTRVIEARCPNRAPRVIQAHHGRVTTNACGIETLADGETLEGADAERRHRERAFRWWLSEHKKLPEDYRVAVLAYERRMAVNRERSARWRAKRKARKAVA